MARTTRSGRKTQTRASLARRQPVRRRTPRARTSARSAREQDTRNRALHALALMRQGASRAEACRLEHIKPQTFLRYVGRAVRRDTPGGRFRAAPTDRLARELEIPAAQGTVRVTVRGPAAARRLSAYANAVAHFSRTGDVSRLAPFRGKTFLADGQRQEFLTDPAVLLPLVAAEALQLDALYASFAERT